MHCSMIMRFFFNTHSRLLARTFAHAILKRAVNNKVSKILQTHTILMKWNARNCVNLFGRDFSYNSFVIKKRRYGMKEITHDENRIEGFRALLLFRCYSIVILKKKPKMLQVKLHRHPTGLQNSNKCTPYQQASSFFWLF